MGRPTYLLICATIFGFAAIAHLSRLIGGWDVVIAGWLVPHWVSVPGLLAAAGLSAWGVALAARDRERA
jgi:hypothetical protein